MGIIADFFASTPGPSHDYWYEPTSASSAPSGVRVTVDSAQTIAAYFAAVRVITETVGSLSVHLIERTTNENGQDVRTRRDERPLSQLLRTDPNPWQTPQEFIEMMTGHAINQGSAFAEIRPGPRGAAHHLVPLNPTKMRIEQTENDDEPLYLYTKENGQEKPYPAEQIFHLRGYGGSAAKGFSAIEMMRDTLGLAKATELYGSRFFSGSAHPRGILQMEGTLDDEVYKRLKASWGEKYGPGTNQHDVVILEQGMEWQAIGISNNDSQFLETRAFTVREIARFFRIPPHMLGDLEFSSDRNVEQQTIEFVKHAIRPWCVRWEQTLARDVVGIQTRRTDRLYFEFNVDSLQRGDFKGRMDGYKIAIDAAILSPNECRAMENRNPYPGGDKYERSSVGGASPDRRKGSGSNDDQGDDQGEDPEARGFTLTDPEAVAEIRALSGRAFQIARSSAFAVLATEARQLARHAPRYEGDREGWVAWCEEFYAKHADLVASRMCVSTGTAHGWCETRLALAVADVDGMLQSPMNETAERLARVSLEG